jgi:hypothetical protein
MDPPVTSRKRMTGDEIDAAAPMLHGCQSWIKHLLQLDQTRAAMIRRAILIAVVLCWCPTGLQAEFSNR